MKIAHGCVEKEKQTFRFISQVLAYAKSQNNQRYTACHQNSSAAVTIVVACENDYNTRVVSARQQEGGDARQSNGEPSRHLSIKY